MTRVWQWLEGKKTYIGASSLALIAIAGFWTGVIDGTQLGEGLSVALAIVGLGHKFDRQVEAFVAAMEAAKAKSEKPSTQAAQPAEIPAK